MKRALVDFVTAVGHDAHNDLLPAVGTPGLGFGARAEMSDVLEDTTSIVSYAEL
jgi:hypothetical protein